MSSGEQPSGTTTSPDKVQMGSNNASSGSTIRGAVKSESADENNDPCIKKELDTTPSLEDLHTDEQRQVLETVANVRKCGLESILSLPQLVVCGDQSAGKSSVLEALTEIPFPRSDNLCTRFATEIILRRAPMKSLTIKIIPDTERLAAKKVALQDFKESITNFDELPRIMDAAKAAMGVDDKPAAESNPKAFARDVLSIEIEGPSRPQLTLVDIPGLIQTDTKGVTKADVELVAEITDQYIKQKRTICLAVVSAANDYANQKILTKVREVDPDGARTLGIITKPDCLDAGSGSEEAFIMLARNEDIKFSLGWHVVRNRKYKEKDSTLEERRMVEESFFSTSNFKTLPATCLGIDTLRTRLSQLLFEHVKEELPKLRNDLEKALLAARQQLDLLGTSRSEAAECKNYLSQLSLDFFQICKAAVDGHYEGDYFSNVDGDFELSSPATIRRIRAVVQNMNAQFAEHMRLNGHKYQVDMADNPNPSSDQDMSTKMLTSQLLSKSIAPQKIDKTEAREWVKRVLIRTRGRELVGNFNPLLIGELFWDQCSKWQRLATDYLEVVERVCRKFFDILLEDKSPKDVSRRLRLSIIQDALKLRYDGALEELRRIMEDTKSYPINYNHYYTETINKRRHERQKKLLSECVNAATEQRELPDRPYYSKTVNVKRAIEAYSASMDPNMENVSCEEALDCVLAIYAVSQKVFVANITTQVVERHMIRDLEKIFSPVIVNNLSPEDAQKIASEPAATKRRRQLLKDQIEKLEEGDKIFRGII